jgi:hypothetical protein
MTESNTIDIHDLEEQAAQLLARYYASELYSDQFNQRALPKNALLEVHRSEISLHHAKIGYAYPTIRLLHTFSRLIGLPIRIYQTVHEGALAFLVVISSKEKVSRNPECPSSHVDNYLLLPTRRGD